MYILEKRNNRTLLLSISTGLINMHILQKSMCHPFIQLCSFIQFFMHLDSTNLVNRSFLRSLDRVFGQQAKLRKYRGMFEVNNLEKIIDLFIHSITHLLFDAFIYSFTHSFKNFMGYTAFHVYGKENLHLF